MFSKSSALEKFEDANLTSPDGLGNTICVRGVSHRTLDIARRERFSLAAERRLHLLSEIVSSDIAKEAVIVNTCNRVEIVTAKENPGKSQQWIERFEALSELPRKEFSSAIYEHRGSNAVGHVFRVASGLDSLVPGENQVFGQVKDAYRQAHSVGATGVILNRLFQTAFGVAKLVRTKTEIGRHAVSVCYAARVLAAQIFGNLADASVMLIGAGDTGTLAIRHFRAAGVKRFFIVNRTLARAAELAELIQGVPLELSSCFQFLPQADIVIGALSLDSSAPAVLQAEKVAKLDRTDRPQFFIDLGVPRNFNSDLAELDGAFLYNIDDLQKVVERNLDSRLLKVEQAENIISDEIHKFDRWLVERQLDPTIQALFEDIQNIRVAEKDKTLRKLRRENFSESEIETLSSALDNFSNALLAKAFHQPFSQLKRLGSDDPVVREIFRELFIKKSP